ncbi:CDPK-related kinase 4 [Linum perenne]
MGQCCAKPNQASKSPSFNNNNEVAAGIANHKAAGAKSPSQSSVPTTPVSGHSSNNAYGFATSPFQSPLPAGVPPSPSPSGTPGRKFKWPFPPPSPAKPIMRMMRKKGQTNRTPIPEHEEGGGGGGGGGESEVPLDKNFGYPKNIGAKYELGKEVGRGHFGHTCWAKGKKGELKGESVAVKVISKAKMTTAIAIEDVRREVTILKSLRGHKHLIKFYDAFEDANNVLCEGGELLDRILSRGGRYTEEDAKTIVIQILDVVAYCHLQGVVHRDLKPENFLFATKDEDAPMKVIDFGLSDYVRPEQRLNDIVGSAYYVAPEVLHRSYSVEADMWSIGVITYILLCGSRPFWARTESGIFRSVLRADLNFNDSPWPSVSPEAKDFLKRLLNKDHRKRLSAAQALCHPWIRNEAQHVPLDIFIFKTVKSYVRATPFRRAALKALSKAIPEDELFYLKAQYELLEPKDGHVTLNNYRVALNRNITDAMKDSRNIDILQLPEPLSYKKMGFEEFCAATISTYQLEALEGWEKKIARTAFEHFEEEGNRVISVQELALEMNLGPAAHSLLVECIRSSDGKLSFVGYTKFLRGVTIRSTNTRTR